MSEHKKIIKIEAQVSLQALAARMSLKATEVLMKLMSNRRKDQVHLLDLIAVGLIDATWPARFPPELGARLQHLLDTRRAAWLGERWPGHPGPVLADQAQRAALAVAALFV